eukprot:6155608-Pyramimonas_sp.AAC.1
MQRTLHLLHKAKRRRYAPEWSIPTELFIVIASPNYMSRPARPSGGIGDARAPEGIHFDGARI